MAERLDTQRPPVRLQVRPNVRPDVRGYEVMPHQTWGNTATVALSKGSASPGTVYPAEPTVTAQDATNAAKLAGLGYVAVPTSNWTSGQAITVGSFLFNWNGSAWAAGAHA